MDTEKRFFPMFVSLHEEWQGVQDSKRLCDTLVNSISHCGKKFKPGRKPDIYTAHSGGAQVDLNLRLSRQHAEDTAILEPNHSPIFCQK